uniref:efflux transporter outer membrane subunit n=1 Tax=Altererythrobacter segetis TaxID=1104773 RepID=UPI001408547A|nr:efflux transporter outer membrane subunit [Altererythrobacter segetis]
MIPSRIRPLAALLLLGGCTVGPDYNRPTVAVPATYAGAHDAALRTSDIGGWWTAFRDPVLDGLIARARSGNLDVRQAAARVAEARAQERVARARGGPSLNASAQAGYSRLSQNSLPAGLANLGGGGQPGSGGGGIGLPGEDFATFQTGFDASWELDLFGGQRRANEAAGARTEAAVWSQRDAEVMLAAEVARTYQQYRVLQRRIALADQALASQRDQLEFVRVRARNGLTTTLDERSQQRRLEQASAQREDLLAEADARVHALGTLLGLAPAALAGELTTPSPAAATAIDIPPGLPSELLQRRPDIRAAERKLAAATADIGVATADLYPKLSLTGALQLASRSLATLLEADSIFANGAGRLSLPLIGGGKRETVALRRAQADEALLAYQATVLGALREVEDALTRLDADRRKVGALRASVAAAQDAVDTAQVRQRSGLVQMTEVLQARQTWLADRDTLAQAEAAAAQDEVALYKALGGGWDERRVNPEEQASGRGS